MDRKGLQQINKRGNVYPYETETIEDWSPDGYAKDCDSYASWKYLRCKEAGVSHKHLAIVTCDINRDGIEDHAVLFVYSPEDKVVYCLDNRQYSTEEWTWFAKWGYRFVRVPVYMQELMVKED